MVFFWLLSVRVRLVSDPNYDRIRLNTSARIIDKTRELKHASLSSGLIICQN